MEKIIKKAKSYGYNPNWNISKTEQFPELYHRAILDPFFWQALGKACGWNRKRCSECLKLPEFDDCSYFNKRIQEQWEINALRFHEINLTEGWSKAVAYLEDLIK